MGVYTWVSKYCCGEELQFQSKSHPGKEWGEIDLDAVPVEVVRDIDGDTQECPHCLRVYRIQKKPRDYQAIPMEVVCDNEDSVSREEDEEDDTTERRLARLEKQLGLKELK